LSSSPVDVSTLLSALMAADVDFVVIGGIAAIFHGSARSTYDVDIAYERSSTNIERLTRALQPLSPYLRVRPPACRSASMRRPCAWV
jgi:hypothetical protein